jgi:hypothetical protein
MKMIAVKDYVGNFIALVPYAETPLFQERMRTTLAAIMAATMHLGTRDVFDVDVEVRPVSDR